MKRNTLVTLLFALTMILGTAIPGFGQLLLNENFDYVAGTQLISNGWVQTGTTVTNPILVSTGGLTYPGYLSSGIGNAASMAATGQDVNNTFTTQNSGTVYAGFMVSVTSVQTTGDYFFHLVESPVTGNIFKGRVWVKKDASSENFAFGVSKSTTTAASIAYTGFTYALNTTYLVVLKYQFNPGTTTDDDVSIYINPVPGAPEPAVPNLSYIDNTQTDALNLGLVGLRQGSTTNAAALLIDGIRIGLTWNDVMSGGSGVAPPTIQAQNITFNAVTSSGMTTGWTNGNGEKRVVIINTTNNFINPADGTDPAANPVYAGTGQQVVFNGNGNSVVISGLAAATTYWFRVYEYNGSGSTTKYLSSTATLNPNSQATSSSIAAPSVSFTTVSAITSNSAFLGGTITGDGGATITERGTVWGLTPGVLITDNKLAEGGTSTGPFSHTRTLLPAQTLIYFKAYASNIAGTGLTNETSFFTLASEPAAHVTGFTASAGGNSSINLAWATASPGADGYLILQRTGGTPPTGIPADGNSYPEGSVLGDGIIAAVVTPGTVLSKSITGLSPGTQYAFTIIPFAWNGTNGPTYNYLTAPVIPSANATTSGSASVIYIWQGADNGSWTLAGNWNPSRTSPAPSDILQFNDGTTKTVTNVPLQTIAKLIMDNNTAINLQSASPVILTIAGAAGTDLEIPLGCTLNLNAINAITMLIATTATAQINGNMKFSATASTAHRLTAVDPGAIVFANGSVFTAGTFFSGNPFGTTSLGSVIFASGSTYLQQAGSNPFGATQPGSVVVFQTGSLFKVMANLTPSFAGRTYANFELDAPGVTLNTSGTSPVSFDDLTISNGTLNFNMTGPASGLHQVKGNILVKSGSILNFSPTAISTVTFSGTSQQSITNNGILTVNANQTLNLANSAGLILNSPLTINGNLTLSNGLLLLGSSNLLLGPTSAINGTPSAAAMIVATSSGQLRKEFSAGFSGSFTFPLGDNSGTPEYSPVTLTFSAGTFAAGNYAGVNLINTKFPGDPNNNSYLKRYWNLASSGITSFNCNALMKYVTADVIGTESEIFSMQVLPAPFTSFGLVNATLHQVSAAGLTAFGTYTGSQPRPVVVTTPATAVGATTATLNGEVTANFNATSTSFEYGLTTAYGTVAAGSPASVTGGSATPVSANIAGLTQATTYHFRIFGTNAQGTSYGNDLTFTTTCPIPSSAGPITGPASVCRNGTGYVYSVAPILNATTYVWTLPAGASIMSGANTNSITVNFSASAAPGNITVSGTSVCGTGTVSPPLAVTIVAQPVPVITGPASACINSMANIYATEPGMSAYTWTVSSGGAITAGAGTNTITVTWNTAGPQSVMVGYTNAAGCPAVTPSTYAVNVVTLPVPTISGPSVVCANAANIVYTTEPGMTNYNWVVSMGGTIIAGAGTNAITVSWPYAGNRTVSVSYTSAAGCNALAPTVYNVTINPAAVPTIGSVNDPCINSTNNQYITNSGMLNYVWNVSPGGTITSGQGTNTIYVTWTSVGAQWVNVSYTNTYGCATVTPTVYNLFVNPLPNPAGPVTGTPSLCAGTSGVAYSCDEIMNAASYTWTLPAGATIATGAGTRNITVNFSIAAVSGIIKVAGTNSCGNGTSSPGYAVTVNPIPPAPVVTAMGSVLTSSSNTGNQWYFAGNLINGATGQTYTATAGSGYYWCVVTINGCSSPISNKVYVIAIGQEELQQNQVNIFPVPNQGKFTIVMTTHEKERLNLVIYSQLGARVFEMNDLEVNGTIWQQIDLMYVTPGIYTVIITGKNSRVVRKIVVNEP